MATTIKFDNNEVYVTVEATAEGILTTLQRSYHRSHDDLISCLAKRYDVKYHTYSESDYMRLSCTNIVFNEFGENLGHISTATVKQKSHYLGKIVRFVYRGGSHPGQKRLVKIESETGTHLYGVDLEQGEKRTYRKDNISGTIELLN